MKIAVTGANGFIGQALCDALSSAGHQVFRWIRMPERSNDRRFSMPDNITESLFADKPDWVIHAAYVTQFKRAEATWEANIKGSMRLVELAEKQGAKMLFLSSLSAHEDAASIYGRSKFMVESAIDLKRHLVVKPGVVVGAGGLFLRMIRILQRLRFAVLFWGGDQPLYHIALNDLTHACVQLIEQNAVGRHHLMEPTPYTVKTLYQILMQALSLKPRMLALPGECSLSIVRCLEKMHLYLPISSENLLGLKHARLFDSDIETMGISPITLSDAVSETIAQLRKTTVHKK
ncbi:MAG: hypothetical protein RLZ35_1267 [Pseudomonadota bacterium]